jgi:diguanylate cyclase (GGDEF)-like protein/putative nucleotidyltransferase with HDIG domain
VSKQARAYWLSIILAGFTLTVWVLKGWKVELQELPRLGLYMLAALATSGFKVRLPGIFSTLSMNYVFIIAGLIDLHLPGGILIGIASVLGQSYYRFKQRPQWKHVVFNLAAISLAVSAANICFEHPTLQAIDPFGIYSMVGASLAYFTVNTVVLSWIIGLTTNKSALAVWKESYLWTSPQYLVGGVVATCFHLLVNRMHWAGMLFTFPVVYLVYRSYNIYLSRVDEQQKHIREMAQLHLRTIEALALAIDAKDDTTSAHLRRVQVYASEVGRELGLTPLEMQAIEAAALLHDIGKLAVPEYIISKPGRLTPDEFEKMKIHPIVGAEILERVNFPYPVVPIVRAHHEKYDGTGYPDGLKGEEIPIGARILSAVDCLDALASDRQYRKAMPLEEAIRIVAQESGKSYDPKVVEILRSRYRDLEVKAKSETVESAKISSNIRVERGASPATGFAPPTLPLLPSRNFAMSISDARREFQMLVEIANDLGSSLSLDETLALLAVRLGKAIPHDAVVIWVRSHGELIPRHVKGESYRLFSSLRIPLGQGLSGWVAENNQAIVNGNPAVESGYLNDPSRVTPLRSAIAVPLVCREQVVGVLTLYQLQADAFTLDHRRILQNISAKVGVVIENALRFEHVQDAARTDELTGLLNPRSLFEYLAEEVTACGQRKQAMGVIVMDLDGFKKANDEHGHLAGNRVLQSVAMGLRKCCRSTDIVARMGGDEFVMVLSEPGDYLPTLMERIAEVGHRAGAEINYKTPLAISAGCALYPDNAMDAESLLEKADERMYEEKRRRKLAQAHPPANGHIIVFPKGGKEVERTQAMGPAAMVQQA